MGPPQGGNRVGRHSSPAKAGTLHFPAIWADDPGLLHKNLWNKQREQKKWHLMVMPVAISRSGNMATQKGCDCNIPPDQHFYQQGRWLSSGVCTIYESWAFGRRHFRLFHSNQRKPFHNGVLKCRWYIIGCSNPSFCLRTGIHPYKNPNVRVMEVWQKIVGRILLRLSS